MAGLNKLIRLSRVINWVLLAVVGVVIVTFTWLYLHEAEVARDLNHLIVTDFKEMESHLEKYAEKYGIEKKQALHNKVMTHLENHTKKRQNAETWIISATLFSGFSLFLAILYLRRIRNLKLNDNLLDEIYYYNQLDKLQSASMTSFSPELQALQADRDRFLKELQHGLKNNHFILYYQPILSVATGEIIETEALIRWQHPTFGLCAPNVFLPLCERSEFIVQLGAWVIETACQQINQWQALGYPKLRVSANLSTRELNDNKLIPSIKKTLEKYQIRPESLCLEITESSLMQDIDTGKSISRQLREMGIHLSLDDFGTGYSSLNYIRQFPISTLKIDKSFIDDIATNITSLGIVEAVINLAKSLGLAITAEGVETKDQLEMLTKMQCDKIQGYLYSKPVPANELTNLLAQYNTSSKRKEGKSHIQYETLSRAHYDQVVLLISKTFCSYEPMTRYLGITQNEFLPFAQLMVDKAIKDQLSIVALDGDKVCACTIVEDISDPLTITINLDQRFNIIFSLLEKLANHFFSERLVYKGKVAHLFITAVDKDYHGSGLSGMVNAKSAELAKASEFDFMYCEFTNAYNERGTIPNLSNNRLLVSKCIYRDFVFEGKKPFRNLNGATNAYIWELREGAKLQYSPGIVEDVID